MKGKPGDRLRGKDRPHLQVEHENCTTQLRNGEAGVKFPSVWGDAPHRAGMAQETLSG